MKLLTDILNILPTIQVAGAPEKREILRLSLNSKDVNKGTIFFAIRGYKTDGHKFIQDALNNGASAVILEDNDICPDELFKHHDCVKIVVKDSRTALSIIADYFYDHPSRKLKVIGITGTKGKSSTAFYIKHLIESFGKKCGLIGTIANYVADKEIATKLTTPEAIEINSLMHEMVLAGCEYCVMEVSSHSLDLKRVRDIDFDLVMFTNLTSDHLDFHVTFENYKSAKAALFSNVKNTAKAIINYDDINAEYFASITNCSVVKVGTGKNNDYMFSNLAYDLDSTRFDITVKGEQFKVSSPLLGKFTLYNAGLAFTAVCELGFPSAKTAEYVASMPQVPGRFEVIYSSGRIVIVDYSHTADSLKQALEAISHVNISHRPVFTVMGCGGDRDKSKRPVMGNIAAENSTYVVVTSDNPRTENPNTIISEIVSGIKTVNFKVLESREEAIKHAVVNSPDNSVVLIAGKGHETYQEINGVRHHFSDKEIALKYLNV